MADNKTMREFKDLAVWRRSMQLAGTLYRQIAKFPVEKRYILSSQLQRCAVSVPSNIAEGYNRSSKKEYVHFLSIALGSIGEIETQILFAQEFGFIVQAKPILQEIDEIGKMLRTMIKKLVPGPYSLEPKK